MKINAITATLAISPQITTDDLREIKAAGYRSIICNRPDAESTDQPNYKDIKVAAENIGLLFVYQPITSGQVTKQDVATFAQYIEQTPNPTFAYCRSGTRSITLWALSELASQPKEKLIQACKKAGYDIADNINKWCSANK